MAELNTPELFDLPDRGVLLTRVTGFEEGTLTIKPPSAPQGKVVPVIRLHVPPEDKPLLPRYWDITSKTTFETLKAFLPQVVASGGWVRIQKFGVAPAARFQVSIMPASFTGPAFYGVPQQ